MSKSSKAAHHKLLDVVSQNIMVVVLILMCIGLTIATPHFFSIPNLMNVALQSVTTGIVAIGMCFVIITGGIDLSVGSVLALSAAIGAGVMRDGAPIIVGILVILGVATFFGFAQGILISRLKMPAFIATLGGMAIARSLTMVYMQGRSIPGIPTQFQFIGNGRLFDTIPVAVIIMVVVYLIAFYVLKYTSFGRYIYALGGNREATDLSGISTKKVELLAYCVSGVTAGIGAIVFLARLGTAVTTAGEGLELDVIGAVVIGGASLSGGRGTVFGTFIGVLIMGVLNNGINLLNVDPFLSGTIRGSVILIAVLLDIFKKK